MSERHAIHEAAHACVAILRGLPVRFVTIRPSPASEGAVVFGVPAGQVESADLLITWLAAGAAELRLTGTTVLDEGDLALARQLAAAMADGEPGSAATASVLASHAALAAAAVAREWPWIERVAAALVRHETIDGGQVAALMDGLPCC